MNCNNSGYLSFGNDIIDKSEKDNSTELTLKRNGKLYALEIKKISIGSELITDDIEILNYEANPAILDSGTLDMHFPISIYKFIQY